MNTHTTGASAPFSTMSLDAIGAEIARVGTCGVSAETRAAIKASREEIATIQSLIAQEIGTSLSGIRAELDAINPLIPLIYAGL